MNEYKVISADSHSNEPESLYDKLPPEYRSRAPHEEVIDGARYLVYEGRPPSPIESPNPLKEEDMDRYWRDGEALGRQQHREGGMHIPTRLADLEKDGVSAEVIFPSGGVQAVHLPRRGVSKGAGDTIQRLSSRGFLASTPTSLWYQPRFPSSTSTMPSRNASGRP